VETVLAGRVWKLGDNISTDLLCPQSYLRAQAGGGIAALRAWMATPDPALAAAHCMRASRPGWAAQVAPGDLLIAGRNFGCGSSRNGAEPLKALGIGAVIVESAARIYLRNSINTGLPTLVCRGITALAEEGEQVRVDLLSGQVRNQGTGATLQGDRWEPGSPPAEILMAGGFMPFFEAKLRAAGLITGPSA
jgi:3-isopropylmalate/(R)-2-methylmalate dehydratase small subunit